MIATGSVIDFRHFVCTLPVPQQIIQLKVDVFPGAPWQPATRLGYRFLWEIRFYGVEFVVLSHEGSGLGFGFTVQVLGFRL